MLDGSLEDGEMEERMTDISIHDLFRLHDNSLLIITWSFMIIGSINLTLDNVFGFIWILFGIMFALLDYLRKDRILKTWRMRLNMEQRKLNERIRKDRKKR